MSYSNITWLRISDQGKNKTYNRRNELHQLGYEFDWSKKEWAKQSEGDDIETAKVICNQYGLKLMIDLPEYRRSYDYRKQFFESKPGLFGKGVYFCSYCGKPIGKKHLEVDHLFSVNSAQNSAFVKWIIKKSGMDTVNHEKNIVPACIRCNRRKGKKSGLWVLRGLIGQNQIYWIVHWTFMLAIFSFGIWFFINHPIKSSDVLTFIRRSVLFFISKLNK
jgi:5-methylcytosine-specific restriction endonuclease McrA